MALSNQEKAIRAKDSALEKMAKRDFAGAKKVALRARKLDPDLPDISQIILVCEAHCPSARMGKAGWYRLLGLDPNSDDATVTQRCKKMVNDLHKSAFPGSAKAFLLVCKANAVLTSRNKPAESDGDNLPDSGFASGPGPVSDASFNAAEDGGNGKTPANNSVKDGGDGRLQDSGFAGFRSGFGQGVLNNTEYGNLQKSGFAAFQSRPNPFDRGSLTNANAKGGAAKTQDTTIENGFDHGSLDSLIDRMRNAKVQDSNFQTGSGPGDSSHSKDGDENAKAQDSGFAAFGNGPGPFDHGSLSDRAEVDPEFQNGTDDHNSEGGSGFGKDASGNSVDENAEPQDFEKADVVPNPKETAKKHGEIVLEYQDFEKADVVPNPEETAKKHGEIVLEYPDSELNDFEKSRDKEWFSPGQIWAVYDTLDAMPRFYARINNIISSSDTTSFEVHVTWLEPCPDNEREKKWLQKGLPASCGRFKVGESENINDIAIFSHLASSEKRMTVYGVYPRKGETWAIFKNCEVDLCEFDFELEFVEIMSDYCGDSGVSVGFLGKIKGFSCLFSRANVEVKIEAKDKLRFSHRISSFRMVGPDGGSGFFELDPASLPPGLNDSSFSTLSDIFS